MKAKLFLDICCEDGETDLCTFFERVVDLPTQFASVIEIAGFPFIVEDVTLSMEPDGTFGQTEIECSLEVDEFEAYTVITNILAAAGWEQL